MASSSSCQTSNLEQSPGKSSTGSWYRRWTIYGDVPERLDRIERTLAEIRDQMATKAELEEVRRSMATKIELEAMNDTITMVADGYQSVDKRLDKVADLLKRRVVMP